LQYNNSIIPMILKRGNITSLNATRVALYWARSSVVKIASFATTASIVEQCIRQCDINRTGEKATNKMGRKE
jgi:hypothetical protein